MIFRAPFISRFRRRRKPMLIAILCGFLLVLSASAYLFWPPIPADLSLPRGDLRLAAWLGVKWSMEAHDPAEIDALAQKLRQLGVDDIYVYLSYLKPDGAFNRTWDYAAGFVSQLKRSAPGIRALAWIGVPVSVTNPDGSKSRNRLEAAAIQLAIAEFALMAVSDLGFDGIHLNAELVADGDTAFLETLARLRASLPVDALFSATAHALRLDRPVTLMPYPVVTHHWSAGYLRQVAESLDQVVLMAYDSGLVFPLDYRRWMRFQVEQSQLALEGNRTELIIGLPTSEEWTPSHQTQAETLEIALAGIKSGIGNRLDAIAVYPFWETDEREWDLIINSLGA